MNWAGSTIPDREDEVKKHGSGDQTPHGNWAHPGRLSDEEMREEYGDHDDTGPLGDDEEFVPGDRVKLISNEKMDWGGWKVRPGRSVRSSPAPSAGPQSTR